MKNTVTILFGQGTRMSSVLSETLRGLAISFLTILDGGTKLAEKDLVYLVDEAGNRMGNGLHDDFMRGSGSESAI